MITKEELLQQINIEDICKVISWSQNIPNPKIDKLLTAWAENKIRLANEFLNGQIKYTHPEKVRFSLNEETQTEMLDQFINHIVRILDNEEHPLVNFLSKIQVSEFFNNILEKQFIVNPIEKKYIPAGSKIVKSFKYFVDNEQLLHDLQSQASILIQSNKVEGYLTFSIHPLDFLSSSENTYNWRSCHALDGEYRAGNLSYIADNSTIIVYLSGEHLEKLPNFPQDVLWNSKKWRMLMHFDNTYSLCFAGKQYPFFSPGALETVYNIFTKDIENTITNKVWLTPFDFFAPDEWETWKNDYCVTANSSNNTTINIDENRYLFLHAQIKDKFQIVKDAPNSRHFNDIIRSSCYIKPYYMCKKYSYFDDNTKVLVGNEVSCLRCGKNLITGPDTMMCDDCTQEYGVDDDNWITCSCCGSRCYYDDAYWVHEEPVCPICADRETFVCECCGERYFNNEAHWDNDTNDYICNYCFNTRRSDD